MDQRQHHRLDVAEYRSAHGQCQRSLLVLVEHVSTTTPSSTPNLITNTVNIVLHQTIPDGSNQWFHLRTGDEAGNWSTSTYHLGAYNIDTVAPAAPVIAYSSHVTNVWSSDDTIKVSWLKLIDSGSPVNAYSYLWDQAASTTPDTTPDYYSASSAITTTSDPLPTAPDYYFHVRAKDAAGNWGATTHIGPFKIDAPRRCSWPITAAAGRAVMYLSTGLVLPHRTDVTLLFTSTTGTSMVLGYSHTSFDGTFQVLATVPLTATENADYYFAATTLNKRARTSFHVAPGMSLAVHPGARQGQGRQFCPDDQCDAGQPQPRCLGRARDRLGHVQRAVSAQR